MTPIKRIIYLTSKNVFDFIVTDTTDDTLYSTAQSEATTSLEDVTTETTAFSSITTMATSTQMMINSTISTAPKGLSGGAIAGIVIGVIVGVIVLSLGGYIIYKYRKRFADMLQKDPRQSSSRSVSYKADNPQTNVNFSPSNEYLTVNTPSLADNQQPNIR